MRARRSIAISALAVALAWVPSAGAKDSAPQRVGVGQTAPDFTLPDPEGTDHSLQALRGEKNVLLVFFRGAW